MKLLLFDNYAELSELGAKYVARRINEVTSRNPDKFFVLGLPTGSNPLRMYKRLIELHEAGQVSFAKVKTFNMCEYVGIPINHAQNYHQFMFDNLFRHIDIDPDNVHIPNGNAPNLDEECASYEESIKEAGGIDLFVSSIGNDGHIAFNEPYSSLTSRTRVQALDPETIVANSRFFQNDINQVPKKAITVGVGTIMDAKEVLMLVNGSAKAMALHCAIEEPISHKCTASALQMHPDCTWLVDEDATLELKVKTVKHFGTQREDFLASMFPESSIELRSHIGTESENSEVFGKHHENSLVSLHSETIVANSRFFQNGTNQVPKKAITVGVGTMDAKEVLMLINGSAKAMALHCAIEEPISHKCTASALQMHPDCTWLDATLELKVKTVKHFGTQREDFLASMFPESSIELGNSPLGMYKRLIELHVAGQVSFAKVKTFNIDEYLVIPINHAQSYHQFIFDNLFRHINIDPENIHIPNGNAPNLDEECASYEESIKEAGGIDLFVSSIGNDGHIAFNEPYSSLTSRTRVQALDPETIVANSRFFQNDTMDADAVKLVGGSGRKKTTKKSNGYSGLINAGATCYMNVVLQQLFFTPEFRNTILLHGTSKDIPRQLQRLFLRMMAGNGPVDTTDLMTAFGWGLEQRQIWEEDPNEFLFGLLNLLIDELPKTSGQILRENYTGSYSFTYKCQDCKERKRITEDFRMITLPVYSNLCLNLEELLCQMGDKEVIDRKCEHCGHLKSQAKIRIKTVPRILTVVFHRCCILPNGQRFKSNRKIGFPDFLQMPPPTKSDGVKDGEKWLNVSANDAIIQERINNGEDMFELICIIIHHGTGKGGHYWAYIKNVEDSRWNSFNDSTIKPVDLAEIVQSFGDGTVSPNGAMLTYRRIKNCQKFARLPLHIRTLQNVMKKEEGWLNDKKTHTKCAKCAMIMLTNTYNYTHKCNIPVFKFSTIERGEHQMGQEVQLAQETIGPSPSYAESNSQAELVKMKDDNILMLNQLLFEEKTKNSHLKEQLEKQKITDVIGMEEDLQNSKAGNGTRLDMINNFKRVLEFGQKEIAHLEQKVAEDEAKWMSENDKLQLIINKTYGQIKELAKCNNDAEYLKEQLKLIASKLKQNVQMESSEDEHELEGNN